MSYDQVAERIRRSQHAADEYNRRFREKAPEPPPVDFATEYELKNAVVDEIASVLVEKYGASQREANELASRHRGRIQVVPKFGGPEVKISTLDGISALRSVGVPRLAFQILRTAEQEAAEQRARENPPLPLTREERIARLQAQEPMYRNTI